MITADHKILSEEKKVNRATITEMPWCSKIWQLSGYNPTDVKQKLPRPPRRVWWSSWSRRGNQKSFTLTIPWNLASLVRNYLGIILRQRHTDQKQMSVDEVETETTLPRERVRQRNAELQLICHWLWKRFLKMCTAVTIQLLKFPFRKFPSRLLKSPASVWLMFQLLLTWTCSFHKFLEVLKSSLSPRVNKFLRRVFNTSIFRWLRFCEIFSSLTSFCEVFQDVDVPVARILCKYSQLHLHVKHDHEHHDQQPRQWVGALSQSHPGPCGTPVGPGKDTLGPYAGRPWVARQQDDFRRTHNKKVQALSQLSLQKQVRSYCHLEIIHGSGAGSLKPLMHEVRGQSQATRGWRDSVEHTVDAALQFLEDILYAKQDQIDRCIRLLKCAKEIFRLVEKSASLAFPCDLKRIQGEIQDGKDALAVALRDLHACREQSELFKGRRISRSWNTTSICCGGYDVLSLTGNVKHPETRENNLKLLQQSGTVTITNLNNPMQSEELDRPTKKTKQLLFTPKNT